MALTLLHAHRRVFGSSLSKTVQGMNVPQAEFVLGRSAAARDPRGAALPSRRCSAFVGDVLITFASPTPAKESMLLLD